MITRKSDWHVKIENLPDDILKDLWLRYSHIGDATVTFKDPNYIYDGVTPFQDLNVGIESVEFHSGPSRIESIVKYHSSLGN